MQTLFLVFCDDEYNSGFKVSVEPPTAITLYMKTIYISKSDTSYTSRQQ
jgi:hypothetical protein